MRSFFRLKLWSKYNKLMIDSGEISDRDILGGRLGFMSFSQEKVIWSAVSARCLGECERFPLVLPPPFSSSIQVVIDSPLPRYKSITKMTSSTCRLNNCFFLTLSVTTKLKCFSVRAQFPVGCFRTNNRKPKHG